MTTTADGNHSFPRSPLRGCGALELSLARLQDLAEEFCFGFAKLWQVTRVHPYARSLALKRTFALGWSMHPKDFDKNSGLCQPASISLSQACVNHSISSFFSRILRKS